MSFEQRVRSYRTSLKAIIPEKEIVQWNELTYCRYNDHLFDQNIFNGFKPPVTEMELKTLYVSRLTCNTWCNLVEREESLKDIIKNSKEIVNRYMTIYCHSKDLYMKYKFYKELEIEKEKQQYLLQSSGLIPSLSADLLLKSESMVKDSIPKKIIVDPPSYEYEHKCYMHPNGGNHCSGVYCDQY